jgi:hypothetical protein
MTSVLIPQLLQERFSLLEVGRLKALGEPAVDRGQQLMGFPAFPLLVAARSSQGFAC